MLEPRPKNRQCFISLQVGLSGHIFGVLRKGLIQGTYKVKCFRAVFGYYLKLGEVLCPDMKSIFFGLSFAYTKKNQTICNGLNKKKDEKWRNHHTPTERICVRRD